MDKAALKTADYLFMMFKSFTPTLEQVCDYYYPHLSKAKRLEKARNMEFPFMCYRLDDSQKSPYLVDIFDLAFTLEKRFKAQYDDYQKFMQSVLKPD